MMHSTGMYVSIQTALNRIDICRNYPLLNCEISPIPITSELYCMYVYIWFVLCKRSVQVCGNILRNVVFLEKWRF